MYTCPVAVYIRKQEEKKRRQGSCFLFLFFQKKKKSNFYLISYVTDSFEFFKRYEKFSAEPWMVEKDWWKKKKEKRKKRREKEKKFCSSFHELREIVDRI